MSIATFFYEHPIFRHEEFVAWKTRQKGLKTISINTALHHHIKARHIIGIRRELFAVIPPNQSPDSLTVDPYLVAAKAAPDSILAYHTALELHGVAYSTFGELTYLTLQKNKPFEFQNRWFQATQHPTSLKRTDQVTTSVQTINRQGMDIRITNLARTYVDILDRIELCGGWEEISRALNNIVVLDVDEVIKYCLILKNARLASKVGYFLEQRQGAFKVSDEQLAPLLSAIPKSPQYTSKREGDTFEFIKKWNIYMPTAVIHQSWEEPDANILRKIIT